MQKQESLRQLFQKRILRMILVLLLISVPYYIWLHRDNGLGVLPFLKTVYSQNATTALWYLYSYLGILFMLPFLRAMVRNLTGKEYQYLFCGHVLLSGFLPCLTYVLWGEEVQLNSSFSAFLFVENSVFFTLLGHYIENIISKQA